jgi:hypothetical protein
MTGPLTILELRRHRPVLQRMILLTAIVCVVFFALGKRSATDQLAVLLGCSIGVVLIVPLGIARDKMEGTLDFVCGLPVEARDIAASRFLAIAALAFPWALGVGALSIAAPAIGSLNPVDAFVFAWLGLLLMGACTMALFTRYDFETLLGTPIVVMILFVAIAPRVVHFWLPSLTPESLARILSQPYAPLAIGITLFAATGLLGALAFGLTVRGFATYRHDAARR